MTEVDNVLVARVERLLKALPPAVRRDRLPRVLGRREEGEPTWDKVPVREVALHLLYPPVAAAAPAPAAAAAPKESIKAKLLRVGGTRLTALSAAISAETPHSGEDLERLVIQRATAVLEQAAAGGETILLLTPGFASGKHWAPVGRLGTNGSAAYSRYKGKYLKKGFKPPIPLFYDERPCASKAVWDQRKDVAVAIEKALHRHFAGDARYRGAEGGSEPTHSNTTHFYVYLALKCTE